MTSPLSAIRTGTRVPRRRRPWRVTSLTVAALLLGACGSGEEAQPSAAEGSSPEQSATTTGAAEPSQSGVDALLPPAEGQTAYPLTLTTWAGETVLEERPERIAVLGFSTNSDMLEVLDVVPVYAQTEDGDWEWRSAQWLDSIEFIDTATRRDPINFEAVMATDPDLIIALNFVWDQADFDRLADIAPVLENAEQVVGDQISWQDSQRLVGQTLDLADAAEDVIDTAEQHIADVAADNPDFAGRTLTIATEYTTGIEYYTVAGGTAEGALGDLGFAPNPLAADFVDDPAVSDENLIALDADALVVIYMDAATQESREASPLFQAIPAVAQGRYVGVAGDADPASSGVNATWVFRRGASALSLPWASEVVADTWLAQIDLP